MEAELFGMEQSNGGEGRQDPCARGGAGETSFIDEIADMPRETQNRIMRVLIDQTFQRVGWTVKISTDVRIISSTAHNLEAGDRGRAVPRGPVSPTVGGAAPRSAARRTTRGHSRIGRLFHGADFPRDRVAKAAYRRGRHGGAAVAYLAGQRAAAAQQHRTADDFLRRRRRRRGAQRQHAAAARRRLDHPGDAEGAPWRPESRPSPPASTPISSTGSSDEGEEDADRVEPPPTQAMATSGRRPMLLEACARASRR